MYHNLPPNASFWPFLVRWTKISRRPRANRDVPAAGACTVRTTPASRGACPTPFPRATNSDSASAASATAAARERLRRRCASSAERSTSASSSFWSPPCGTAPHHAASANCSNTSAPTAAPSHAGRSSGANWFPARRSGRSRGARLTPDVDSTTLPIPLLDAFLHEDADHDGWKRLLCFLAPITIPGGLRIELS